MPSVDPAVARARAAAVAERFYDFPACAAAIRELLSDYADRSHRVSQRLASITPVNAYKTAAPVVRLLTGALRELALVSPEAGLELLPRIWAGGSLEERQIAAELLGAIGARAPAAAQALVESWLIDLDSADSAQNLARLALRPLAASDPAGCLAQAQRWAASQHKWTRCFALAALEVLAEVKDWDDVPGALAIIRQAVEDSEPEMRHAAAAALAALLPKSPPEINAFLREQAQRTSYQAHLVVRALLPRLNAEEQAALVRLMR